MSAHKKHDKNYRWTQKLAYAIGLITTDGNLSGDKRHISLSSSDIEQLENFKKCLNLKCSISKNPKSPTTRKQGYRVQFSNVCFYRWLEKIGLCPNKSFKLHSLLIPDKCFRDFIRGHLDGDGSIIVYEDRYNTYKNPKYIYERLMVYLMSASRTHVEWLQRKIMELTNLHGAIQIKKYKLLEKKPNYVLKFSKKESIKFLRWIYYKNNLPCLTRKYNKAKKFLVFESSSRHRKRFSSMALAAGAGAASALYGFCQLNSRRRKKKQKEKARKF